MTDKETEFALDLGTNTVRVYYQLLKAACGVRSRVELVIWAYSHSGETALWPTNVPGILNDETNF